ncbi:unnamed protein product [Miscanthus lutarioriparius]|uniref:Uncharacterized protein n=1 Tax=Miscanthus lutarioriparius TaxID=422564 RepID=A0A811RA54_9POAL|nr:unnamed protein product [Miscanthus lutarioriparius]
MQRLRHGRLARTPVRVAPGEGGLSPLLLLSFTRRRRGQPSVYACRPPFLGSIRGLHDQIQDLRGWIRSFPHRIWPGGVLSHRLASRDVASSRTLLSTAYDVFDTMPITARQVRKLAAYLISYWYKKGHKPIKHPLLPDARSFVKFDPARVKDVQKVPHFIVYEDPDRIDGESWTIQCEVLQHKPQGEGPPDEDAIPDLNLELGPPFDFFGLGQPVNGPNHQHEQNQWQQQNAWDPWPEEVQAQDKEM